MSFLKNLKLGSMLGLGFAVVIISGLIASMFGRYHIAELGDEVAVIANERMSNLSDLQTLLLNANIAARGVRNMALLDDEAATNTEMGAIEAAFAKNEPIFARLRERQLDATGRAMAAQIDAVRGPYRTSMKEAMRLAAGVGNNDEVTAYLLGELRVQQQRFFASVEALADYELKQVDTKADEIARDISADGNMLLMITGLAGVAGICIAWAITRHIKRQLGGEPAYATEVARQIASGNLAFTIQRQARDTDSLLAEMESMRQSLAQLVGEVRQSSEAIASGASQIASGNTDLSQRTEEQASSLEQTAAAMEEMTSIVHNNAENVRTAGDIAASSRTVAVQGGEMIGTVVGTMNGISDSSRKIADIIGVIDSIAFQTNILALNAAVEAARAGEQGKGFAVVAGEVRSLAQRSAQAAREIKALIQESVSSVEAGVRQVSAAGTTMENIMTQASRVADVVSEIGAATREQSQGIGQVSDAVSQLDQTTQQNAALVEEAAAAAASLNEQARHLVGLVRRFQIDSAGTLNRVMAAAVPALSGTGHGGRRPALAAPASSPRLPA